MKNGTAGDYVIYGTSEDTWMADEHDKCWRHTLVGILFQKSKSKVTIKTV